MLVLVTSFGPFLDVVDNPSGKVARSVVSALGEKYETLHLEDFETSVEGVKRFINSERERTPLAKRKTLILQFGVSRSAKEVCVETLGRNRVCFSRPDVRGFQCEKTLIAGDNVFFDPAVEKSWSTFFSNDCLPVSRSDSLERAVLSAREDGLPVALSTDAGQYVCNFLFTSTLCLAREQQLGTEVLFFHVVDPSRIGIEDQARSVLKVLQSYIE